MRVRAALLVLVMTLHALLASAQDGGDAQAPEALPNGEKPVLLYQILLDDAVAEFNRGSWETSRDLFRRAHELRPNARTLRGMGMADYNLHAYARAIFELEAALTARLQALDEHLSAQVRSLIERASDYVGRYTLLITPADAIVRVDGAPPLLDHRGSMLLDLGVHSLELRRQGFLDLSSQLEVRGPEHRVLTFHVQPVVAPADDANESPRRSYGLTWGLGAASAAAFISAGGTYLGASARFDELKRECRVPVCLHPASDGVTRLDRATVALLGTGGVLLATTLVAFFLEHRAADRSSARRTQPKEHEP